MTNAERLRAQLQKRRLDAAAVDLAPRTAHEALTRAMLEDLAGDVEQLRARVDTLIWAVVGAVVVGVVLQLVGALA